MDDLEKVVGEQRIVERSISCSPRVSRAKNTKKAQKTTSRDLKIDGDAHRLSKALFGKVCSTTFRKVMINRPMLWQASMFQPKYLPWLIKKCERFCFFSIPVWTTFADAEKWIKAGVRKCLSINFCQNVPISLSRFSQGDISLFWICFAYEMRAGTADDAFRQPFIHYETRLDKAWMKYEPFALFLKWVEFQFCDKMSDPIILLTAAASLEWGALLVC